MVAARGTTKNCTALKRNKNDRRSLVEVDTFNRTSKNFLALLLTISQLHFTDLSSFTNLIKAVQLIFTPKR